ncbi:Uncharacterised protein [Streptococcus pneumoniae]|nr:Uncharacterised protein [Streptococcus pneumoniae]CRF96181.1 Uncharacterised protein [Streptococcus pneumoniae]
MISVKYSPNNVKNKTGMVITTPVLKYVPQEILTPFCANTCNHNNVASEPIGVILGPKSEPITLL